jgi:hypothetical protein
VFFLLTRCEEIVRSGSRDRFERFPAGASLAAAEGFLERPLVDEYVELLWAAMRSRWPRLERRQASFRLRLTHDVDEVRAVHGRPGRRVARAVVGDVTRRRDLRLAAGRSRACVEAGLGKPGRDPFDTFDLLMEASERHGLRSTFYVVAGARTRLSTATTACPSHASQHSCGGSTSGGTRSVSTAATTAPALGRRSSGARRPAGGLPRVRVRTGVVGIRQHFLRFRPDTWRHQDAAGLAHDSTVGYADRIGFRAGTCREFPVFDLRARERLALRERPLIVMDRTLYDYMALGPDAAAARTRSIVDTCRHVRGDAVLLVHNTAPILRRRGAYPRLVADLVEPG